MYLYVYKWTHGKQLAGEKKNLPFVWISTKKKGLETLRPPYTKVKDSHR